MEYTTHSGHIPACITLHAQKLCGKDGKESMNNMNSHVDNVSFSMGEFQPSIIKEINSSILVLYFRN